MAKKKTAPQPLAAAHQSFLATAPPENQAAISEALADAPAQTRGALIDVIQQLRALNVPWGKLIALLPLIAAAIANPTTNLVPLILALVEIFAPAGAAGAAPPAA